jgi:hypothetical protein
LFKKGEFVRVTKKIKTIDQYDPPRKWLDGRYGVVTEEDKNYPSVQFYRYGEKDPSLPMKIPTVCLEKITEEEFWLNRI